MTIALDAVIPGAIRVAGRPLVMLLWLALGGTSIGPMDLGAQTAEELRRQAEQQLGRPISDDEILRRLRSSGLSPDEIRAELMNRGYDPEIADSYLAVLEGRATRVSGGADPVPVLELVTGGTEGTDRSAAQSFLEEGLPVFGRDLFRRASTEFQPINTGPVPSNYRVGPGDELSIILTGDVEQAYLVTVSREGWVVIPDVGRIPVQGRTMDEVNEALFQRLSQAYSGIRRDDDATTFFDVTVGRLRTNQVFVIGEVERPGGYTVSALATALTALYQAGGPTRPGSFRRVVINRGGEVVGEIDLYEYLTEGRAPSDLRLQNGDIVFVPVSRSRVQVSGPVVRPGIYELLEGEDLRTLLHYSGGLQPQAEVRRVQVERVLPPEDRSTGMDRAVLDVPLGSLDEGSGQPIPVRDGDRVTIFAVLEDVRNEVRLSGGVWRPGRYGAIGETRLWDLIERAGGLLPDVVEGRAQIQRLRPDWTRELIPVSLARDAQGEPLENPVVEGMDEVLIFAARGLREDRAVSIGGWVREPGVYPYTRGMTVADLILQAGGLRTGAYIVSADVSRVLIQQDRTAALTRQFEVLLDSALVFEGADRPVGAPTIQDSDAGSFQLENLDAVYVRKAPGFDAQASVLVQGEVLFPGPYSLETRVERLVDVIGRAGGPTEEAYLGGLQLWRLADEALEGPVEMPLPPQVQDTLGDTALDPALIGEDADAVTAFLEAEIRREEGAGSRVSRTRVGIDATEALRDPASRHNVLVEANDSIYLPPFIPTVDVRGAVASPTKVLHVPGRGLDYYVEQAGGYLRGADQSGTRVQYAGGEVAVRGRRFLGLGGGVPNPDPGSVITVREIPLSQRTSYRDIVTIVSSTVGTLATLIVLINSF
jgi:protein involved in polysaccharide export with SLBB domain